MDELNGMDTVSFSSEKAQGSSSMVASSSRYHPYSKETYIGENAARLLAWREASNSLRRPMRRLWGDAARWSTSCTGWRRETTNAKQALAAWAEAELFRHCTAKYCPLQPAPRSTIAAAYSPDGSLLASTHGDHTVKIICCMTGTCIRTLFGHLRTPWVVRFNPCTQDILASGSLDNEVKLWDTNTAKCFTNYHFYRPISSLAFHAEGDILAIASGHKLYAWQYKESEKEATPIAILRTRRSLRAVHFHPHAAPLLLTAEASDLDAPDCPMTVATSPGYSHYPHPAIIFTPANLPNLSVQSGNQGNAAVSNSQPSIFVPAWIWPSVPNRDVELEGAHNAIPFENRSEIVGSREGQQEETGVSEAVPMDTSARPPQPDSVSLVDGARSGMYSFVQNNSFQSGVDILLESAEGQALPNGIAVPEITLGAELNRSSDLPETTNQRRDTLRNRSTSSTSSTVPWSMFGGMNTLPNGDVRALNGDGTSSPWITPIITPGDNSGWGLSFLQGWVMGQSQAGIPQPVIDTNDDIPSNLLSQGRGLPTQHSNVGDVSSPNAGTPAPRVRSRTRRTGIYHSQSGYRREIPAAALAVHGEGSLGISEAAATAELPCAVKLRLWPYDIKNPVALLDPQNCRLTIPHAVLCSEMGAHFSPCGRFLAACVACVLPSLEPEASMNSRPGLNETPGASSLATSPTHHPISAQKVIYELRIYSLEEATFGQILASRAIRAAHCLTSIQFSPTSNHILLAYGRRHSSLLRSILVNGTTTMAVFTILEVYRISDMELVKVLPSAEDEVNVACFHPFAGGGLAYGTKEGKLRILQLDRSNKELGSLEVLEENGIDH